MPKWCKILSNFDAIRKVSVSNPKDPKIDVSERGNINEIMIGLNPAVSEHLNAQGFRIIMGYILRTRIEPDFGIG